MNKLAINLSDLTRKKKKAKVNFVLDLNKASTSTANNNESPKTKVFKNSPKLEPPEIVQKSGFYSVVKDLMETPVHITFEESLTESLARKPNTVIGGMVLVLSAGVINYYTLLVINACPA
ncbi:hypothetical protein G9A89_007974 [Geosiphon pyriformis]|nr:hypothetical protein G9A89_007974 [Geosiphon pyriformis]